MRACWIFLSLTLGACIPPPGAYPSGTAEGSGGWYGGQVRVTSFQASIAPTKANGDSWDGLGGKPDPFIQLYVDGQLVATCKEEDRLQVNCDGAFSGKVLNLKISGKVEVRVYDADTMEHDSVGGGVAQASSGTMAFQTNGQLTSATLEVQPH